MGTYFYYKILLPYSVYEGNKICVKTDFGIHNLQINKFIEKGKELKFKIFIKNTDNNNYFNNKYDNNNDYYDDDENINPFNLSIPNNNYLNRFHQHSYD
jgi:hypothetical protein